MTKKQWMPREKWDSLVTGKNCPLCKAVESNQEQNEFGTTITNLKTGKLRLLSNQYCPGYCIFIANKHIKEPHYLEKKVRQDFFQDIMAACSAIEAVFAPLKMNITLLGNSIPHLHAHLIPRYYNDDAPDEPIDPTAKQVLISQDEQKTVAEKIRNQLFLT